ncbi:molybdopterin converting factor subunit 1 [Motiliproteus coralliicola]|uniref:Molybdopterin synthase sulfur carrier subunit n=1 Tax=Motiliproteus coralliicola TaxID=2283196 RepID=A0A369W9G7_9GAMM|nr:molybdopterin converting factor subunit 1 [Motiliproteus coralliicola]RDE18482.1 molybdopterin converting factor subunit 1 [Motiliproteus coralliicola]
MIKLVFLASIRERLGCDQQDYPIGASLTVAELIEQLSSRGDDWQQVLADDKVLVAVNQQMSRRDALVQSGDEVAFFPPVTGG